MSTKIKLTIIARDPQPWDERERSPLSHTFSSILFWGLTLLLMFGPLAFGAVEAWAMFVLEIGSGLLLALWVAQHLVAGEFDLVWNPVLAPAALFAIVVGIQVFARRTVYWHDTYAQAVLYCAYVILLFLATQTVRTDRQAQRFLIAVSVYGFLLAFFAILQDLTSNGALYWIRKPEFGGFIFGPYVNHSHYAGLMEMLIPMPLLMSLDRTLPRGSKTLFLFAAVLMSASLLMSQSRGGVVAFVAEMAFVAVYLLVRQRDRRLALAIAGVCVLALGFLLVGAKTNVFSRFHDINDVNRIAILRDGLRMMRERPLLGYGLGNFPTAYPAFRSFHTNKFVNAAHNDYLQALTETGIIGFAAVLLFVVMLYGAGLRRMHNWRFHPRRMLSLAALAGCTGLLIHGFVDFNLQIPANAAWFFFLSGLVQVPRSEDVDLEERFRADQADSE